LAEFYPCRGASFSFLALGKGHVMARLRSMLIVTQGPVKKSPFPDLRIRKSGICGGFDGI
jgi:hypothetical protein